MNKRCPFCGGNVDVRRDGWGLFYGKCDGCKATFRWTMARNEKDFLARFNRRETVEGG